MKRRTIVILAVTSTTAVAFSWPFIRAIGRADRFLDEATTVLATGRDHPGVIEIELKAGGSFRAILEHSCCSGAGFAAVALQTSNAAVYHSRNNYCGEEGFYAAMSESDFGSLSDLDAYLLSNGYTKTGQNKPALDNP